MLPTSPRLSGTSSTLSPRTRVCFAPGTAIGSSCCTAAVWPRSRWHRGARCCDGTVGPGLPAGGAASGRCPRASAAGPTQNGRVTEAVACPKRMTYGPCGGVREDLRCEMAAFTCVFAGLEVPVPWHGPEAPPVPDIPLLATAHSRPVVLADLTVRPFDTDSVAAVTAELATSCDAVLVGEHQDRPD